MRVTIYGIPNCDTVKKARTWMTNRGNTFDFHDFKKLGVPTNLLEDWADTVGWEQLLNKRGTTFRGLSEADKMGIERGKALRLMSAHSSLIKRPVVSDGQGRVTVGFSEDLFNACWCD
ncbi:MAG: arsenate reductase [Sphingomicrobium sp.]